MSWLSRNLAKLGCIDAFTEPCVYDTGSKLIVFHTQYIIDTTNGALQDLIWTEVSYSEF